MNKIALGRLFKKMEDQEGNKMFVAGDTVPTDAASGYAKGCIFIDTDGTAGLVMYVNEGSATSCDFNAVVGTGATSYLPLAGGTLTDAANVALGTTTGTKIGTAVAQKLGFWNATPVIQQASADQADQGALTAAALTDNGGGAAADGTIAEITNSANAGSADVAPVADAIKELSDQINKLIADNLAQDVLLTAMRSALVATGIMKGAA